MVYLQHETIKRPQRAPLPPPVTINGQWSSGYARQHEKWDGKCWCRFRNYGGTPTGNSWLKIYNIWIGVTVHTFDLSTPGRQTELCDFEASQRYTWPQNTQTTTTTPVICEKKSDGEDATAQTTGRASDREGQQKWSYLRRKGERFQRWTAAQTGELGRTVSAAGAPEEQDWEREGSGQKKHQKKKKKKWLETLWFLRV